MEMFDEIVSTKIEDGQATVEREPTEDTLQAEAMKEACGMFLSAERKFQKISAHPDVATDPKVNVQWWDALERVFERERTVWKLFVGPQPDAVSNRQYAEFRRLLVQGKSLKADA